MANRRVALITHSDLDVETFPWEKVKELVALGVILRTEIAAQLGIPSKAITNKVQLNQAFSARWEEEVTHARSESTVKLLRMLWEKADAGDRPAIETLLKRMDPGAVGRPLSPQSQVNVIADKAMILTGQRLEDKLVGYRKTLRIRQQIGVEQQEEQEDG